jgi:hypothetical protein
VLLRIAGGVAIVAAATAAAILLNLALLGYAQPRNDRVGKLSPRAVLAPTPAQPATAVIPRRRAEAHEFDD